ncbi:MAG: EamA family transporter [Lachnospiraceae bacterium]|nr:EamA family transporter [Lachnospiraceae bacterium]
MSEVRTGTAAFGKRKGIIMTLAGASCWGLSGSVGQYLFSVENMDSRWLVPVRLGAAGIILLLFCFIRFGKEQTLAPWKDRKKARTLLVYGIAGVSACQFLYFLTIQLSNAAMGTVLQDLAPIFILGYTCLTDRRSPRVFEVISIGLALLGVFLLTTHGAAGTLAIPRSALVSGILSAVCVMVYNVVSPKLTRSVPVVIVQGWAFVMGGVLFSLIFRIWSIRYVPGPKGILGIIFVVVIGNIAAFLLYITGVSLIGPSKAILYSFAEPVTAALVSAFVLGTKYTVFDLAGFLCIFAMLWMITFSSKMADGESLRPGIGRGKQEHTAGAGSRP